MPQECNKTSENVAMNFAAAFNAITAQRQQQSQPQTQSQRQVHNSGQRQPAVPSYQQQAHHHHAPGAAYQLLQHQQQQQQHPLNQNYGSTGSNIYAMPPTGNMAQYQHLNMQQQQYYLQQQQQQRQQQYVQCQQQQQLQLQRFSGQSQHYQQYQPYAAYPSTSPLAGASVSAPPPPLTAAAASAVPVPVDAFPRATPIVPAVPTAAAPKPPQPAPALAAPQQHHYCETCEKEFNSQKQYDTHMAAHEKCSAPGCSFTATKKVVSAHYHAVHGLYSGDGYRTIEVEGGQRFNVLVGKAAEDIEKWKEERRRKFPTADVVLAKARRQEEVRAAGGITSGGNSSGSAKGTSKDSSSATAGSAEGGSNTASSSSSSSSSSGPKKRRCSYFIHGRCNKTAEECSFSHDFTPKPCISFTQRGRCRNGYQCKFAHVRPEGGTAGGAEVSGSARDGEELDELTAGGAEASSVSRKRAGSADGDVDGEQGGKQVRGNLQADKADGIGKNAKASINKQCRAPASKKQRKDPNAIPKPLDGHDSRGSLLSNLLRGNVDEEENVVLQCFRFIVEHNYFLAPGTKACVGDDENVDENNAGVGLCAEEQVDDYDDYDDDDEDVEDDEDDGDDDDHDASASDAEADDDSHGDEDGGETRSASDAGVVKTETALASELKEDTVSVLL